MTAARLRPAILVLAWLAIAPPAAAALEESDCRLEHASLPAVFARCSTLEVPVDHARPEAGTLQLYVARVPALTANPAPDPLVLINGGPGGSGVDLYLQTRAAFEPARRDRDIILVDQRGTGRSLAGLTCDVAAGLELETASPDELRTAVADCIAAFPSDPRLFTTSVAVRDLDLLRAALGAETWNVYGVSYGTRVAQHYLRRYPAHTRSVILDGVVPAELVLGPAIAADAQRVLDAIFERCANDSACSSRFPDLAATFAGLHRRFAGDRIEVLINDPTSGAPESFELAESHLQAVVRLMSYSDLTVALLPLVIEEADRGNYAPLAAQAKLNIEAVAESIGFAMHNSVVCTEDAPYFGAAADPAGSTPYLGTTVIDGLRAICETWPAGFVDPDFKEPVVSDRPVLLLSGEYDPITPPAYAAQVAADGLRNSRQLIAPGKGHGVASIGCLPRLIRDFLDTADPAALDADCLDREVPAPFFLSFQGPAP
jgi:pimeloyl-ACP methyl ester carboxylesterase